MRRVDSIHLSLAACIALAAATTSAEIYRYVDAEGREHFTENPAMVPPEQRRAAPQSPGGTLSGFEATSESAPRSDAWPRRQHAGAIAPHAPAERIDGRDQADWRAEADHYVRRIEAAERALGRCEERDERRRMVQGLTDLDACEASRSGVESAAADLERFEDIARRRGVPPGWLR